MGPKDKHFHLNDEELRFLSDRSIYDRKRDLTERIVSMLGNVEQRLSEEIKPYSEVIPHQALAKRGKITRGENYLGLPYLLLDYPSIFGRNGVFAFRTLIWWANPVIITFHLSGDYLDANRNLLSNDNIANLPVDFMICINDAEWEHHHGEDNYITIETFLQSETALQQATYNRNFIKLARIIPLKNISSLDESVSEFTCSVLRWIRNR